MDTKHRMTREELEQTVIEKAMRDPAFKAALLADAGGAISREFGRPVPNGVSIQVLEEDADTRYIVLPHVGFAASGDELNEAVLDSVAAGRASNRVTDNSTEHCDIC